MKNAFLSALLTLAVGAMFVVPAVTSTSGEREATDAGSTRTAGQLYAKHCASCHGRDGRAKTFKAKFNHARDLTESAWQGNVTDERIFNSIMNGKGKKMPSYGKKLSEQEIDSLVAFVRGLKR